MEKTLVHLRENSLENQLLLEVGRPPNLLATPTSWGTGEFRRCSHSKVLVSVCGSIANAIEDAIENATSSSGDRPDV